MEGMAGGFSGHHRPLISKWTHSNDGMLKVMNSDLDTIITVHVLLNSGWVVNQPIMREEGHESPHTRLQQALYLDLDLDLDLFRATIPIPRSPSKVPAPTGAPWMKMIMCLIIIIIYLVVLYI